VANVGLALKEALLRRSLTSDIDIPLTASLLGGLLVLLRAQHSEYVSVICAVGRISEERAHCRYVPSKISKSTQALSDAVSPLLPQAFQLVQRHEFNHTVIAILEALTLKTKGT
jgi:hypothetical protein